MNVLVTGGTGALGRDLVVALRSAGHRARVMSRRPGTGADWAQGNLATGKGLDAAVADMDAVVHAGTAAAQPWRVRPSARTSSTSSTSRSWAWKESPIPTTAPSWRPRP